MSKGFALSLISLCLMGSAHAALTFSGNTLPAITETPSASTGLKEVYVLSSVGGVTATSPASARATVYRYSALGGGYAEEIPATVNGSEVSFAIQGDMGYIVDDNGTRTCYWIVDHSAHPLSLETLTVDTEQSDCGSTSLTATGQGDRIIYYSINGAPLTLDRELELRYSTMEWSDDAGRFQQTEQTTSYPYLTPTLHTPAPLCDTDFELSGDRFMRSWGNAEAVTTPVYNAIAVSAHTSAEQASRDNANEQKSSTTGLGGSAPCEIEFTAAVTDGAIFREWQISRDPEFNTIALRFNEPDVTYTFRDEGSSYARFVASNDAGTCDWYSETYEISIGASALQCPNAFSPGATEGINDEWKVSYKSLIDFECHIFNRWGQKMTEFTDPASGWDGTYKGKTVPAGVYYYVIRATGADGKEYKLSGDINIVRYKNNGQTASPE